MPRTAVATPPVTLDQLIERGRNQGHLSLAELRDAFAEAGISPSEGRTILRELSEAGVSLAAENEPSLSTTAPPHAQEGHHQEEHLAGKDYRPQGRRGKNLREDADGLRNEA
ncbi:hypothetical protein GCM10020001_091810 [Nonomuraea salmonea]